MNKTISILLISTFPFLLGGWFYNSLLKEIIRDIRFFRILHYILVTILGGILFYRTNPFPFSFTTFVPFAGFFIALLYAAVFAIVTNNIEDEACDRLTNKNRPLIQQTVVRKQYWGAAFLCQAVSLLIASIAGAPAFLGIVLISLGYFVYSCKPFKLKRFVLLAKSIIGFNSLVVASTGFVMAGGHLNNFPIVWMLFIFLSFSLSSNFVDLKDTLGDKLSGVRTLPVIYGEAFAKRIIVLFTMLSYAAAALLLNIPWAYPVNFFLCLVHIALLCKEPYKEKPVFLIYLFSIAGLNILLLV